MEEIKQLKKNNLTTVDFFCGSGIGAYGIERAGFETILAFDNNKKAIESYQHNFPHVNAKVLDVKEIEFSDIPYADVYVGGFPCQPFSTSGKNLGRDDPERGNLGEVMCSFILNKKPKAFLMENVKGLINKKNKPFMNELIDVLSKEYNVKYELIDCSEYGVPQKRERVFIVGIRKDIKKEFVFPEKSKRKYSIKEAIGDLPKIPNNINNHDNIETLKLRNDEKPFIDKIPIGGNWKDLNIEDQKKFMKKGFYSSGGRTGALKKIDPNGIANTILSTSMGKATSQILDWGINDPRRYTARESLRLQSVPDDYNFPMGVSANQQLKCIGNGIPPLITYKLMNEISKTLIN